jgi:hypothetical protein
MWRNPVCPRDAERALDAGKLYVAAIVSRDQRAVYWLARRNGATKTWKLDETRIRIPMKCGLRSCGAIENPGFTPHYWRIANSRAEAEALQGTERPMPHSLAFQ